jgi:hypothetical protein
MVLAIVAPVSQRRQPVEVESAPETRIVEDAAALSTTDDRH